MSRTNFQNRWSTGLGRWCDNFKINYKHLVRVFFWMGLITRCNMEIALWSNAKVVSENGCHTDLLCTTHRKRYSTTLTCCHHIISHAYTFSSVHPWNQENYDHAVTSLPHRDEHQAPNAYLSNTLDVSGLLTLCVEGLTLCGNTDVKLSYMYITMWQGDTTITKGWKADT